MVDELECSYEEYPRCPYCGHARHDCADVGGDGGEVVCPECGREYRCWRETFVEYTTAPMEGWPDDGDEGCA